jgi:hypothetical protein
MLYLAKHGDSPLLETDRHFREEYNLVSYGMALHDNGKFALGCYLCLCFVPFLFCNSHGNIRMVFAN